MKKKTSAQGFSSSVILILLTVGVVIAGTYLNFVKKDVLGTSTISHPVGSPNLTCQTCTEISKQFVGIGLQKDKATCATAQELKSNAFSASITCPQVKPSISPTPSLAATPTPSATGYIEIDAVDPNNHYITVPTNNTITVLGGNNQNAPIIGTITSSSQGWANTLAAGTYTTYSTVNGYSVTYGFCVNCSQPTNFIQSQTLIKGFPAYFPTVFKGQKSLLWVKYTKK